MSTANMNTTARKAAAALLTSCARIVAKQKEVEIFPHLLTSCARIVAMTAFCVALVAVPAGCSIVTGHTPIECGKGCQDV